MKYYIALVRKEAKSSYGVEFPDFPGCISAGDTLDEAARMGAEALEIHVKGMLEDGEAIPDPSTLDDIEREAKCTPVLVPLKMGTGKVVRVNVTFAEDVLAAIDDGALQRNVSRSALLAQAAHAFLEPPVERANKRSGVTTKAKLEQMIREKKKQSRSA